MFEKLSQKVSINKKFPIFLCISIILCAAGIVGLVLLPFGVTLFNLDIDFEGGSNVPYEMHATVTSELENQVRDLVIQITGDSRATVQSQASVESVVPSAAPTPGVSAAPSAAADVSAIPSAAADVSAVPSATADVSAVPSATADVSAVPAEQGSSTTQSAVESGTEAAGYTQVLIRTTVSDLELFEKLRAEMKTKFGADQLGSVRMVSPSIGADMRSAAVIAAVLAIILILLYIAVRFQFKSGVAAIIALVHDILVMLSVYVIFQIPMNINFIAAALTILGYSVNSTVILFDRVRENLRLTPKESFGPLVDRSIWQTMTRNVNTTLTVVFTLVMLLILGVPSIRNFMFPLLVGIISGAYSSIFLSGPMWVRFGGSSSGASGSNSKLKKA